MKFKSIIATLAVLFFVFSPGLAANAVTIPDPSTQGGANGVIYMTEAVDGAIYIGDFNATPSPKAVFWQQSGSYVDMVSVTGSRIAWGSSYSIGPLKGQILISNLGSTSGVITTVTLPGTQVVTSLAADYFRERFYMTTDVGNIYSVKSDGTDLLQVFNKDSNSTVKAAVQNVNWGAWFDSYNSKYYFCNALFSDNGGLWRASASGTTLGLPERISDTVPNCDGLGVDPADQTVFAISYAFDSSTPPLPRAAKVLAGASTPSPLALPQLVGRLPSSMFVSHTTSKLYFSTEERIYEANYNGSGLRELYSGVHSTYGFENIAVYYNATVQNISQVAEQFADAYRQQATPEDSTALQQSSTSTLAETGADSLLPLASGIAALWIGIVVFFVLVRLREEPSR